MKPYLFLNGYPFGGAGRQIGAGAAWKNLTQRPLWEQAGLFLLGSYFETFFSKTKIVDDILQKNHHVVEQQPIPEKVAEPYGSFRDYVTLIDDAGKVETIMLEDGRSATKAVKVDNENKYMHEYGLVINQEGLISEAVEIKKTPVLEVEGRPSRLRETDIYYPKGIKNYQITKVAVERSAAMTCKNDLTAFFNPDQPYAPSLVLGGDHTQGLATNLGVRLSEIVKALLAPNKEERLKLEIPDQERDEVLRPVREKAEALQTLASDDYAGMLRITQELGQAVSSLVDQEAFKKIRNEELYKTVEERHKKENVKESYREENARRREENKTLRETGNQELSYLSYAQRFVDDIEEERNDRLKNIEDTGVLRIETLLNFKKSEHVIWFDAHGDCNTEGSSNTKNPHGKVLAAALGYGNMGGFLGTECLEFNPRNIHILGARDTDVEEREFMNNIGVRLYRMKEIQESAALLKTEGASEEEAKQYALRYLVDRIIEDISLQAKDEARKPCLILSLDVDGIRATDVFATGTPVEKGGPRAQHAFEAFRGIASIKDKDIRIPAIDLTEFNPWLATVSDWLRGTIKNMEFDNMPNEVQESLQETDRKNGGVPEATRNTVLTFVERVFDPERPKIPVFAR
jgi:arginase family enzyme